jgi:hypothetical protein
MLSEITQPGAAEESLRRRLDNYAAMDWINQNTAKEAGVIFFEETRGFYLDRNYLWGNAEHSSYIPYESFRDSAEMSAWLRGKGIRYALINLNWSPQRAADTEMGAGPAGNEENALRRWYVEAEQTQPYRKLIQEALRTGRWRPVFARNGIVVLEIEEAQP